MKNYILPTYKRININFISGKGSWLYTEKDNISILAQEFVNCLGMLIKN